MKTLTHDNHSGYDAPVAGKIQQYGFCSLLKRWTLATTVFIIGGFFVRYFAVIGRDSQGAFGLAASFSRSANLIIPPFLRFAAQEGVTRRKGALS